MARKPLTEEQRQLLRANLARGRATAAANRAARAAEPKVPVAETPEFRAAIAAVEQEIIAAVIQRMAPVAEPAPVDGDSLRRAIEQMALSFGDLANQNSGQKLVPPEILVERQEADRKMRELILECRTRVEEALRVEDHAGAAEATPRYRLVAKIIAPLMNGDELIEPMRRGADNRVYPTELDWLLPPNLAMVPINGIAERIFALFKKSIGNQRGTRVTGVTGSGDAQFGEEPRGFLTNQGHVVSAGSASLARANGASAAEARETRAVDQRGLARIAGQDPMRQHSGPPSIQVRVLGSIAPPAVQNG